MWSQQLLNTSLLETAAAESAASQKLPPGCSRFRIRPQASGFTPLQVAVCGMPQLANYATSLQPRAPVVPDTAAAGGAAVVLEWRPASSLRSFQPEGSHPADQQATSSSQGAQAPSDGITSVDSGEAIRSGFQPGSQVKLHLAVLAEGAIVGHLADSTTALGELVQFTRRSVFGGHVTCMHHGHTAGT
jgi:hypothetical protein